MNIVWHRVRTAVHAYLQFFVHVICVLAVLKALAGPYFNELLSAGRYALPVRALENVVLRTLSRNAYFITSAVKRVVLRHALLDASSVLHVRGLLAALAHTLPTLLDEWIRSTLAAAYALANLILHGVVLWTRLWALLCA